MLTRLVTRSVLQSSQRSSMTKRGLSTSDEIFQKIKKDQATMQADPAFTYLKGQSGKISFVFATVFSIATFSFTLAGIRDLAFNLNKKE